MKLTKTAFGEIMRLHMGKSKTLCFLKNGYSPRHLCNSETIWVKKNKISYEVTTIIIKCLLQYLVTYKFDIMYTRISTIM